MEQLQRFVRSLPAFQPDDELPSRFADLLGRLEAAEDFAPTGSGQARRRHAS